MLNSEIWKKNKITIYDFESILLPEENGKQNPNDFYTNEYQKHVTYI